LKFYRPSEFTGKDAWDALPIASMNGITTRLHWTDKPYHWHVNDGQEVFVVLDGTVDMHYRTTTGGSSEDRVQRMNIGDIFFADVGTEHVAHPVGVARVLVVEQEGSE